MIVRAGAASCRDLVELVTDYLEDALPRRERRRFERHLASCEGCAGHLQQMRVTIAALRSAGSTPAR